MRSVRDYSIAANDPSNIGADIAHPAHIAVAKRHWLVESGTNRLKSWNEAVGANFVQRLAHPFWMLACLADKTRSPKLYQHPLGACRYEGRACMNLYLARSDVWCRHIRD